MTETKSNLFGVKIEIYCFIELSHIRVDLLSDLIGFQMISSQCLFYLSISSLFASVSICMSANSLITASQTSNVGKYHVEENMATNGWKPTTLQLWTKRKRSFSSISNEMIWAYSKWPLLNQIPTHVFKVTKGIMIECSIKYKWCKGGILQR